jgi:hypothetical protein
MAAVMAGTVTSWAVTVIGSEGGSSRDHVLTQAEVLAALAGQTAAPTAAPSPSAVSTPTPTPTPTPAPEPSAETPAVTPSVPPHPSSPLVHPTSAPPPTPAAVARTWDVDGGQVGASCSGAVFTLLYATPRDGWTMRIDATGTDGAEIEFHREGSASSTVNATCVAGVPTMDSTSHSDD